MVRRPIHEHPKLRAYRQKYTLHNGLLTFPDTVLNKSLSTEVQAVAISVDVAKFVS